MSKLQSGDLIQMLDRGVDDHRYTHRIVVAIRSKYAYIDSIDRNVLIAIPLDREGTAWRRIPCGDEMKEASKPQRRVPQVGESVIVWCAETDHVPYMTRVLRRGEDGFEVDVSGKWTLLILDESYEAPGTGYRFADEPGKSKIRLPLVGEDLIVWCEQTGHQEHSARVVRRWACSFEVDIRDTRVTVSFADDSYRKAKHGYRFTDERAKAVAEDPAAFADVVEAAKKKIGRLESVRVNYEADATTVSHYVVKFSKAHELIVMPEELK